MLFISITFTLLATAGIIFLLIRVRSGEHGSLIKWLTYLLLLVATGLLICQLALGTKRLFRYGNKAERHGKAMHQSGKHHSGRFNDRMSSCHGNEGCCCSGMNCCGDMGKGRGGMMSGCGDEEMRSESTTDTIDGKVIHKEIKVIEKKDQ